MPGGRGVLHVPRESLGLALKTTSALRWSLRAGAGYFLSVTAAHWAGFKVPGLFVYYDIPSYAYQDRGIGIMSFGWAMFLLGASAELALMPYVVAAGVAGILGFSIINLSPEIAALAPAGQAGGYWAVVGGLGAYLAWLIACWRSCVPNRR